MLRGEIETVIKGAFARQMMVGICVNLHSLVKSIRDLLFSRGPSVARQPHLPRKQALAQQPANELNP